MSDYFIIFFIFKIKIDLVTAWRPLFALKIDPFAWPQTQGLQGEKQLMRLAVHNQQTFMFFSAPGTGQILDQSLIQADVALDLYPLFLEIQNNTAEF